MLLSRALRSGTPLNTVREVYARLRTGRGQTAPFASRMATRVRVDADGSNIHIGDLCIPRRRPVGESRRALEDDYASLYTQLFSALRVIKNQNATLSRIGALAGNNQVRSATPVHIAGTAEEVSTLEGPALLCGPPTEETTPTGQTTDSTEHEERAPSTTTDEDAAVVSPRPADPAPGAQPRAPSSSPTDVTLINYSCFGSLDSRHQHPVSQSPSAPNELVLADGFLRNCRLVFKTWTRDVKLTDAHAIAQQKSRNNLFPHRYRLEQSGESAHWVQADQGLTIQAAIVSASTGHPVDTAQLLSKANSFLTAGQVHPSELLFHAYVVNGSCQTPTDRSKQSRPCSIGESSTITGGGCVYVSPLDGRQYTSLLPDFKVTDDGEYQTASATPNAGPSPSTVSFTGCKFRPEALSSRIKNDSDGSLRFVVMPEHPVIRALPNMFTMSPEFYVGSRVRAVSKRSQEEHAADASEQPAKKKKRDVDQAATNVPLNSPPGSSQNDTGDDSDGD